MRKIALASALFTVTSLAAAARAQHDDMEPTPASVKTAAPSAPVSATSPAAYSGAAVAGTAAPTPAVAMPVAPAPVPAAAPVPATRDASVASDVASWGYLPSLMGPIGLFRMSSADVGTPNHLRLAFNAEYFKASNVLVKGDSDSRLQGGLRVGYTPVNRLELFSAVLASNNKNVRDISGEAFRRDPEVIRAFGDVVLGAKVAVAQSPLASFALEGALRFLSSVSGLSFSPDSTSAWLNAVGTLDMRGLARPVPLRLHLNAGYYFDNSENVYDLRASDTMSQAAKVVAMYAYGVARSRVRLAVGAEVTADDLTPSFGFRPFVEYHAEIVTRSADPDFPDCGGQACQLNRDAQWLTVGARIRAWKMLTIDLGADISLRQVGFPYGTHAAPYNLIAGLALPLDLAALLTPREVTRYVDRVVEKQVAPAVAHVRGVVRSAKDGAPIGGAVVAVQGVPLGRVATDADGNFRSIDLKPGPVELQVSAPGFETAAVRAIVHEPRDIDVEVKLTPRTPIGNLRGKVIDAAGKGIESASVKLMGPDNFEARTDANGAFSTALPAGRYQVHVEAPGLPAQDAQVEVVADQDRDLEIKLVPPPAATPLKTPASITVGKDTMKLKLPIRFNGASANVAKASLAILNDIADAMQANPDIKKLHIDAHWDSSAPADKAQALTEKQAYALKSYLIGKGVAEGRLDAVGQGSNKPRFPNIGPGKAKNRRVELRIDR